MRTLRLVALSADGKSLILVADGPDGTDAERFALPVDDRVRAAARGDARRLIQMDVDSGTELAPRVIQSRIRAGETPEQVAASSGARVERIMRFAHPVLQERERVADQAREARVRLSDGGPGVPLQQFMVERIRLIGTDVEPVRWDAFRGNDGSWVVTGAWRAGEKSGTTRWRFDPPSRTVAPSDAATTDFAEGTRLVRVVPEVAPAPRGRPVQVVRAAPQPEPEPDPPPEPPAPAGAADEHGPEDVVRDVHAPDGSPDDADMLALLDEVAEHDTVVLGHHGGEGEDEDPRARIPAWEDIVFGVRRNR